MANLTHTVHRVVGLAGRHAVGANGLDEVAPRVVTILRDAGGIVHAHESTEGVVGVVDGASGARDVLQARAGVVAVLDHFAPGVRHARQTLVGVVFVGRRATRIDRGGPLPADGVGERHLEAVGSAPADQPVQVVEVEGGRGAVEVDVPGEVAHWVVGQRLRFTQRQRRSDTTIERVVLMPGGSAQGIGLGQAIARLIIGEQRTASCRVDDGGQSAERVVLERGPVAGGINGGDAPPGGVEDLLTPRAVCEGRDRGPTRRVVSVGGAVPVGVGYCQFATHCIEFTHDLRADHGRRASVHDRRLDGADETAGRVIVVGRALAGGIDSGGRAPGPGEHGLHHRAVRHRRSHGPVQLIELHRGRFSGPIRVADGVARPVVLRRFDRPIRMHRSNPGTPLVVREGRAATQRVDASRLQAEGIELDARDVTCRIPDGDGTIERVVGVGGRHLAHVSACGAGLGLGHPVAVGVVGVVHPGQQTARPIPPFLAQDVARRRVNDGRAKSGRIGGGRRAAPLITNQREHASIRFGPASQVATCVVAEADRLPGRVGEGAGSRLRQIVDGRHQSQTRRVDHLTHRVV